MGNNTIENSQLHNRTIKIGAVFMIMSDDLWKFD